MSIRPSHSDGTAAETKPAAVTDTIAGIAVAIPFLFQRMVDKMSQIYNFFVIYAN